MIHPASRLVIVDEHIGRGLIATVPIACGTLLWVRDVHDAVLSDEDIEAMGAIEREEVRRLGYRDHDGKTIVCGDGGRYVNHSCAPAMRGVGPDAMIAVRDIETGEELTCDYAECNLPVPMPCFCGTPACRSEVRGDDLARFAGVWQSEVLSAVARGRLLDQPLLEAALDRDRLSAVLAGSLPPPPLADVQLRSTP